MTSENGRSMPTWLVSGLIVVAVLVVGYFVWGEFTRGTGGIPDKKVHAGMYDFKKEAESGNLGRRSNPKWQHAAHRR